MRWFRRGPVDPVAEQLNEIESRGRSTISLAHIAAFLVLMVFSLGSLVGLTGDSLNALLSQWRASHTTNLTAAIAISVSTLLVFAMDIGMYYAAMRVRVMKRRNQGDGVRLDWGVIISVGIVEALSYAYMSYLYDHPHGIIWVLIALRAASAPALAAYLSLAESSPVGERDIVQSVERVVAHGVITEMTRIAGDPRASLERKLALYKGARGGLDALISAESQTRSYTLMPAPQLPQPSLPNPQHDLYGIAAEPTLHLPPAAPAPQIGPIKQPSSAPFVRPKSDDWEGPDDDGPDGDGGLTFDEDYTGEIPAIYGASSAIEHNFTPSRNGHRARAKAGRDEAPPRKGRPRYDGLTDVEVDLLRKSKRERRLEITRRMMSDNPAVTRNAILAELGKPWNKGLSTNARTVDDLMSTVYEENEMVRPFRPRAVANGAPAAE